MTIQKSTHTILFTGILSILFTLVASTQGLYGQTIYALSGTSLVSFDGQNPSVLTGTVPVAGIAAGQTLAGIDFRPNTGELFGLGYNQTTGEARLYNLNLNTGLATAVGAMPVMLAPNLGHIGFDFNPTVDRIRVTGSNNNNYRLNPITGGLAATDGNLAFAAGDVNAAADPNVVAVAYTNSYIGSTATTLYNYDATLNILTTQAPPNNGTLNTVGSTGIVSPTDMTADMDIYLDAFSGANIAFFVASEGNAVNDNLYRLNLATGAATLVGPIGAGAQVSNIAVLIDRTVSGSLTGDLLYALTSGNNLISFDAALPGTIRTSVPVSGIATGQVLSGIDFRPATGQLFGLGYNTTTGEARLYTLHTTTGVATAVGSANIALAPGLGKIGFDFNPTVDRIRVTGSNNSNYRLNPITGALAATDGMLAFAATDANAGRNPSIGALAYTNSFGGSTATTLYNYDDSLNIVTTQAPPNNGTLNTVGSSGISLNLSDPSADMDIFYDNATMQNRAYLVANTGTSAFDNLYTLNLTTGAATLVGQIGLGIAVTDVAAYLQTQVRLACPGDTLLQAPVGVSSVAVTYTLPVSTSTCINGAGTAKLLSGPASGASFNTGSTEVCYTVADSCGSVDTCCFTVTVNQTEAACDVKSLDCVRFELLSVGFNANNKKVYRARITNNCTQALDYVAFELQQGTTAVGPANNATYTAVSGRNYAVRNASSIPFQSVRFRSQGTGISGGQSDIFEYTIPQVGTMQYFRAQVRLADGATRQVYLNTLNCPVKPFGGAGNGQKAETESVQADVSIFPNPTTGVVFADLSAWEGLRVTASVYNAFGKPVFSQEVQAMGGPVSFELPASLPNGAYFLELRAADGSRSTKRLHLIHG